MAAVKVKGKYWAEWQCTEHHLHRKLPLVDTRKAARDLAGSEQSDGGMHREVMQELTMLAAGYHHLCKSNTSCLICIDVDTDSTARRFQLSLGSIAPKERVHDTR